MQLRSQLSSRCTIKRLKLARFERINRLDGDCTYWNIYHLLPPELSRDISLIPSIAKARAKMAGIMNKRFLRKVFISMAFHLTSL